jgi:phage tail tape-measure protein
MDNTARDFKNNKTIHMKQFLPLLSLAILMTACTDTTRPGAETATVPAVQPAPVYTPDTAGLADFQQWKAANELVKATEYKKAVASSHATAPVKRTKRAYSAPVAKQASPVPVAESTTPGSTEESTMSSESDNTAKAAEKKGWSKAAKGTAIGAGAGAAAGAVINKKNRVVGGVIGGVVGGAVGYGLGRHMDKKDGRY